MFERIIVGVDGREGGRDALALAQLLRDPVGSQLVALNAFPVLTALDLPPDPELEDAIAEQHRLLLGRELDAVGVQADAEVVADGSPARALQLAAEQREADLIVVGSDRNGPIGRVLAGDVTAGVLRHAPCAVAVAPRGYADATHAVRTIGVGFDGSPESLIALDTANALAQAVSAKLEIYSVAVPSAPPTAWMAFSAPVVIEFERVARESAQEQLRQALDRVGAEASGAAPEGLAHELLIELSSRVDLLVVGSRRYGPLRRLLLGSTSRKLVHEAHCPVLVLPRGAQVEEDASGMTDASELEG